jgi:hypothetical protein
MGALIDDISRVIASSVSRRQAFKMVTGSVGGAVLASLGFGRAARVLGAQVSPCPEHGVFCMGRCYPPGSKCCGDRMVCNADQNCCSNTHCCDDAENCCGSSCCHKARICCNGICCSVRTACCGGKRCCPALRTCCNGTCCAPFSACCGGTTCCPPGSYCCGTECQRTRPSPSTGCVPVRRPLGPPF